MFGNRTFYTEKTELSGLVINHPRLVQVCEYFGMVLPYGQKTIAAACSERNIRPALFLSISALYCKTADAPREDLTPSDIPAIVVLLKNTHRYYLEEIYPEIQQHIQLLSENTRSEEMRLVEKFFDEYFSEVKAHLDYENQLVFPYIEQLLTVKNNESHTPYSVQDYQEHHDDIEQKLDDLINLLIRHLPDQCDQKIRRNLYFLLKRLDDDLKIHSQIEEQILIPLVRMLEQNLQRQ